MTETVNPYNFVSFGPERSGALADGPPPTHDRVQAGTIHGTITVTFEAVTPLLILDDSTKKARSKDTDHWVYRTRVDPDGSVVIPPTAIKGVLRSAHEAVTNSRMGAFSEHNSRLGYRLPARAGAGLTPARLARNDIGDLVIRLLDGVTDDPRATGDLFVKPAFVPVDLIRQLAKAVGDSYLNLHAKAVAAKIRPVRHNARNERHDFDGWRVTAIRRDSKDDWITAPNLDPNGRWQYTDEPERSVVGHLFITGEKTARNKHEERLFFSTGDIPELPLDDVVQTMWRDVMRSYEAAHDLGPKGSLKASDGPQAGVVFAAHLTRAERRELREGSLLYVKTTGNGCDRGITEVHPVAIGRKLFDRSPRTLVPSHVLPAQQLAEASPTDRLFGFVTSAKSKEFEDQAHRGSVRVVSIDASDATLTAIGNMSEGLPLQILGSPKPQQARFYLGVHQSGSTSPFIGNNSSAFSGTNQVLRGRKFHWHHQDGAPTVSTTSWQSSSATNQNRSITDWIDTGSRFTVTLSIRNALPADLGALIWLLEKAHEEHPAHLRCGLAKPLGFGSLKVSDMVINLTDSEETLAAMRQLRRPATQPDLVASLVHEYENAVEGYDALPQHLEEYLTLARGDTKGKPVGYPRNLENDNGYEWFMENAKAARPQALPLATTNPPTLKSVERPAAGQRGDNRGNARGRNGADSRRQQGGPNRGRRRP